MWPNLNVNPREKKEELMLMILNNLTSVIDILKKLWYSTGSQITTKLDEKKLLLGG